jgi:hypothetical protein
MYLYLNSDSDTNFLNYNQNNLKLLQGYVVTLFNNYQKTNKITNDFQSEDYNIFQNTLINLCSDPLLPGICGSFLSDFCSQKPRNSILNNSTLIDFCGCYVPPDPVYLSYTVGNFECTKGLPNCVYGCDIKNPDCFPQPQCDPLCHRTSTSQKSNEDNGNLITCTQNICVIDENIINSYGNNIEGNINFNSICGNCGNLPGQNSCLCIISNNDNLTNTTESIQIKENFNTFCGGSSVCIQNGKVVNCNIITTNFFNELPPPIINYGIIVIFLTIILFVFVLFLIYKK